jgi:hypothetical protein
MSDLQTVNSGVPANIQDVAKEVLIGRDRLDAIRAALSAAKKLNRPTYLAMKSEGQEYGDRILDYELLLKKYFQSLPKASGNPIFVGGGENRASKMQAVKELGFTQKEVEKIQQLTPKAVEQAKAEARENDDIPTRSLALRIARQDKSEAKPVHSPKPLPWNYVYNNRESYADNDTAIVDLFEDMNNDPELKTDEAKIEYMRNNIEFYQGVIKAFKRAITEMGY